MCSFMVIVLGHIPKYNKIVVDKIQQFMSTGLRSKTLVLVSYMGPQLISLHQLMRGWIAR